MVDAAFVQMVDGAMFNFKFEVSGHQFGTILNLFALTVQSASMYPSPVKYCLSRMQETLF